MDLEVETKVSSAVLNYDSLNWFFFTVLDEGVVNL